MHFWLVFGSCAVVSRQLAGTARVSHSKCTSVFSTLFPSIFKIGYIRISIGTCGVPKQTSPHCKCSGNKRHASANFVSRVRANAVRPPPALAGQTYNSTRLCTSDAAAARTPDGLLGSRLCTHRRLKTVHAPSGGGAGPGSGNMGIGRGCQKSQQKKSPQNLQNIKKMFLLK